MPLSKSKTTAKKPKPKATTRPKRTARTDASGNVCAFPEHASCPLNDPVANAAKPYLYQKGCRNADGCGAANSTYYKAHRAAKKAATAPAKRTKKTAAKKVVKKTAAKKAASSKPKRSAASAAKKRVRRAAA